MTPLQYTFQYNGENLQAFSEIFGSGNFFVPIIIGVLIVLYAGIYFLAPHIYSIFIYREREQEKKTKRTLIQDLILMKEIQTELEKEIEASLLHSGMQKGV